MKCLEQKKFLYINKLKNSIKNPRKKALKQLNFIADDKSVIKLLMNIFEVNRIIIFITRQNYNPSANTSVLTQK